MSNGAARGHAGTVTRGHGEKSRGREGLMARGPEGGPESRREHVGLENGRQRGNRTHIARFVARNSVR
jgi:hypothetical protein